MSPLRRLEIIKTGNIPEKVVIVSTPKKLNISEGTGAGDYHHLGKYQHRQDRTERLRNALDLRRTHEPFERVFDGI